MTPDYSQFTRNFLGPLLKRYEGEPEKTREHSFEQLNALALALREHFHDPRVGLLEKTGGSRVRERAADILAYDLGNGTAQLVDVIGDAEGVDGTPRATWGLVPESEDGIRQIAQWKAPYPVTPPVVEPPDVPEPPLASTVELSAHDRWLLSEVLASSKRQELLLELLVEIAKGFNG